MASSRHQDGSGGGGGSPAAGSAPTKSLKSPRQLPRVPGGAGAPPRGVFDFPPEFCSVSGPGAPSDGSGYDFEDLSKMAELKSPKERSTPRSPSTQPSNSSAEATPSLTHSPPVFEFCGPRRHVVIKTLSCPAKSPLSPSVVAGSPLKFCSGKGSLGESEAIGRNPSSRAGTPPPPSRSARKPGPQASRPNESQGCPREAADAGAETGSSSSARSERYMSRRSTSDLTEFNDAETEVTLLSSPRRRGSMKGGLAYLASRRGSRDSQASNLSNVSNEEIGPLNFSAHPRGRQRRTSNFLELPVPDHIRPRVHSLPEKAYNPRSGDDLYRLRAFNITDKGVINRGDSIISRRSRSNTSVNSSRNSYVSGDRSPFEGSCCSGQGVADDSIENVAEEITKYRVVLLGDSGVGKTALVSQFMTSEFMNTYDASLDDEFGEKTVSILLDGEESDMVFIDHPHIEMSLENSLSTYEPHACIVVYSLVSRSSFQVAEDMLNYLSQENYTKEHFVIVVGNKSDLARSRTIPTNEGKKLATSHDCKFIETSSGIKHNVDELLVGVLKQIRLRESRDRKYRRQCSKGKMLSKLHGSKTALSLNLAREILNKICLNDSKSKSCENLHVL